MPGPLIHLRITAELVAQGQADTLERIEEKCRRGRWSVHDLVRRRNTYEDQLKIVSLLELVDDAGVTEEELGDWLHEQLAKRQAQPKDERA